MSVLLLAWIVAFGWAGELNGADNPSQGSAFDFQSALAAINSSYSQNATTASAAAKTGVMNALAMGFTTGGSNVNLGMAFDNSRAAEGISIQTYGLNMASKVGSSGSVMNSGMYFSQLGSAGKLGINLAQKGGAQPAPVESKSDMALWNDSTFNLGSGTLKLNYRNIGSNFTGFNVLRNGNAASADFLNQAEREKGIQRLGVQLNYAMGKNSSTLIDVGRISDNGHDIIKNSFKIGGDSLSLSMDMRSIDREFSRFSDLAEGERDQWAREKGVSRSNIQLGFASSQGNGVQNLLGRSEITDTSGKIMTQFLNFTGKGLSLSVYDSKVDSGFARLGDLANDERVQMALRIRQQFDPNAKAGNITGEDLAHIGSETGIERRSIRTNFQSGGMSTMLQMLNVVSGGVGINRQGLSIRNGNYGISGFVQSIDPAFGALSALSPIEKQNFGNESGMRRMNFAGDVALNPALHVGTTYARVTSDDSSLLRYGLSMTGDKFNMGLRFRTIDPNFTRIRDLADSDREALASEQGMRVMDLTSHLQASDRLTIDSFFYNAKHSTLDLFKKQLRNSVMYRLTDKTSLSLFTDKVDSGSTTQLAQTDHRVMALTHQLNGIDLNLSQDVASSEDSSGNQSALTTNVFRVRLDPMDSTSLVTDYKSVTNMDGVIENKTLYTLDRKLSTTMAFKGTRLIAQTIDSNTVTQEYKLSERLFGSLNVGVTYGDTLVNNAPTGQTRELSLIPDSRSEIGPFKQIKWDLRLADVTSAGNTVAATRSVNLSSEVAGKTVTLGYASSVTAQGVLPNMFTVEIKESNPNPNNPITYNVSYKPYIQSSTLHPVMARSFGLGWNIDAKNKFTYSYDSCNKANNRYNYESWGLEKYVLTSALTAQIGLVGAWEGNYDYQNSIDRKTFSLGLQGKFSKLHTLEASYGLDSIITPSGSGSAHSLRLKYDYQLNADHYLSLNGTFTKWVGTRPADADTDDIHYQIDYRMLFN